MNQTIIRKSCQEVWANPDREKEHYVLVTQYYPGLWRYRGVKLADVVDNWDRSLAPSAELLKTYRQNKDWESYKSQFYIDHTSPHVQAQINKHIQNAKGKQVVLVCKEPDGDPHCHTHLLIALYEQEPMWGVQL